MKTRVLSCLLALFLCTLLVPGQARSIDFKIKGQWLMAFDYGQNGNFTGGRGQTGFDGKTDEFNASQRLRLQLDAAASENLSGRIYIEIGKLTWGSDLGGALGTDATIVKVKQAFIDWAVPNTSFRVRMGLQNVALPGFTMGNQVLVEDIAGITANWGITPNLGITVFWVRPLNDNMGSDGRDNYLDNVDAFGLTLPITLDGAKITPWGMYAAVGNGAFDETRRSSRYGIEAGTAKNFAAGMVSGFGTDKPGSFYANAFWAGITGELTFWEPLRLAWDFTYGSVDYGNSEWNRRGWLASLLLEYRLDWGIPGLYGWYGSGDDNSSHNGSERLPSISANNLNNGFSNFAFNGNPYIPRDNVLSYNMSGTWGIGARLKDVCFLDDVKHTLRVNLMGGTNSSGMVEDGFIAHANDGFYGVAGLDPIYMTFQDYALEIGLTTSWKMYENFTIMLDASYLALWLRNDVWRDSPMRTSAGTQGGVRDAWNIDLTFAYVF